MISICFMWCASFFFLQKGTRILRLIIELDQNDQEEVQKRGNCTGKTALSSVNRKKRIELIGTGLECNTNESTEELVCKRRKLFGGKNVIN